MYKDADIITKLSDSIGTDAARMSTERLLRVPQAWEALREPEFLQQALEAAGGQALFPSLLAALILGADSISAALAQDEISAAVKVPGDFESTARQAMELCRIERSSGPQALVDFMLGASDEWRSAFICGWGEFEDHAGLLEIVAESHHPVLASLIASALLAYMSAQQAAGELLAIKADMAFRYLPWIGSEPDLQRILRDELVELADLYVPEPEAAPDRAALDARILSQLGRSEAAHEFIRTAWDHSTRQTALVADHLAEIARHEEDLVLESEARQQALATYPSSARRSAAALSLLRIERYEEALNLVREAESFEETIAAGLVYLGIQDAYSAGKKLNEAAQVCSEVTPSSAEWFLSLASGLEDIGYQVQAIQVYRHLIAHYPARAELRSSAAKLLAAIGDDHSAIEQATVAITLDPQDTSTQELLATSYEQIEEPQRALRHWEAAAAADLEKNIQLGQCALAAGKPEVAEKAADRILTIDPEHEGALVLIGRSLSAAGQHSEAKTILQDVIDRSPGDAHAWIALAASMQATGENEQAGHTLRDALQANPDDPELHIARAVWLKSMDRNAEALDHVRSAISHKPEKIEWNMLRADLLFGLGHFEDAKDALEKITKVEPANWTATEKLARTLEKLDEIERAVELVQSAPEELTPESAYFVGRLMALAGSLPEHFDLSTRRLSQAKGGGCSQPSLDYWLGVSEFQKADHQQAAKHFLRYLESTKDYTAEHYLEAAVHFADAALQIGETTMALTQLEKVKPSFPTSIKLLSSLSEALYKSGDRDKALGVAREALELHPDSDQALQIFKQAAERAGELDDALEAQQKITAKAPADPNNWLAMAALNERKDDRAAARQALAKSILLGRQDGVVLSDAADRAESLNLPALEIRLRRRAVLLDEANDALHEKLAKAASRVGNLETAAEAWLECAARNPKDTSTLISAAKTLWKLDRRTAAIGLLQQSAALTPENAEAHFELGRALVSMNELERGLKEISTAVSLDPENSILRAQAASMLAKHADPTRGLAMLNGSHSAGKLPIVAEARAACHWLSGQVSEARKALGSIPAAVPFSVKGAALQALIKLSEADTQGARSELSNIRPDQIGSSIDLEWVLLAGLALEDFTKVSNTIDSVIDRVPCEPDNLLIALQAVIHMKNLEWIQSSLAGSRAYSKSTSELHPYAEEAIKSLFDQLEGTALPGVTISAARTLMDLSIGRLRADNVEIPDQIAGFDRRFIKHCVAIALLRANRPLKAIQQLESLPDEPYSHTFASMILGLAHTAAEQYTAAKRSFETAAGFAPWKSLALYFKAQMWEKSGAFEDAISALNEALSIRPDEPAWHMKLASMYTSVGQSDAALPHLQQAAEMAPEAGEILVALARAYRTNGQLSDAEELYARSLQSNPASPKVWKEAGQVALASGDNDRAEAWFERACSLLPADASCLIDSARAAQRLGKSKQALERARKAYELAPDDPQVLSGLGDILAENGSLDKAIQIYDRAMRISEQNAEIGLARSKLLLQAGRPQESISDLEQLVDSHPDHHQGWELLAKAYASKHEYDAGLHAAQQAVNIAPRNIDYRLLMAQLCRHSGQLDQALDILSAIENEAPDRLEIAREKGIVHEQRRELELAIDAYNRALALDSHDAQTVVKAGLLLKQLKAYEESAELLERGTKLIPNDADLHQQLAAVRALQFVHGQRIDEQVVAQ